MLLYRQKLDPTWGTYQHFMLETGQALRDEAQQNKNVALSSSVLVEGQWVEAVADDFSLTLGFLNLMQEVNEEGEVNTVGNACRIPTAIHLLVGRSRAEKIIFIQKRLEHRK